jgi:hypothetical protein
VRAASEKMGATTEVRQPQRARRGTLVRLFVAGVGVGVAAVLGFGGPVGQTLPSLGAAGAAIGAATGRIVINTGGPIIGYYTTGWPTAFPSSL